MKKKLFLSAIILYYRFNRKMKLNVVDITHVPTYLTETVNEL